MINPVPQALRHTLVSLRELLLSIGPLTVLAVGLLWLAYLWLDPTPPRRMVLATGPAQSAYAEFGKQYREALKRHGIDVVLLPSDGSQANLELLRQGHADLGFVQGGSGAGDHAGADGSGAQDLVSLGSLFVEPLWLFVRDPALAVRSLATAAATPAATAPSPRALAQIAGLRLNIGATGSGIPALMQRLFEANGLDAAKLRLSRLEQTPATVAFLAGELDALVFASAPESLMVQMLLQTPGVRLLDFAQSEAYSRRLPFLAPVVLPRGIVSLASDLPREDVRLVATTTSLLARADTHPALIQLVAQAARDIHGKPGWFQRARTFPSLEHAEVPLSREAERAIRSGPGFLQRWLPFWLSNLVERMWLALGLIVAVLLPLSRIVPPLYTFRIRSRVFRWYGQLRDIESRLAAEPERWPELARELDALDARVGSIELPLSYADELYALRGNIAGVRQRMPATALLSVQP